MRQGVDGFGIIGTTIKTATGYLDIAKPKVSDIDIYSIARGLSRQFRYAGQTPKPYSVAEHCVLMATAHVETGGSYGLEMLMHDAAEAFIGDMPKPIKQLLPKFIELEQQLENVIVEAFGLRVSEDTINAIKDFDRRILKTEKQTIWPRDKAQWAGFNEIKALPVELHFLPSHTANDLFLDMFFELYR